MGWDGKRGLSIQGHDLFDSLRRLHCILDIVIQFFCQTKCCGTPVSNGDNLVIASPPELMQVFFIFPSVIHSHVESMEEGFHRGGKIILGTEIRMRAARP